MKSWQRNKMYTHVKVIIFGRERGESKENIKDTSIILETPEKLPVT